MSSVLPPPPGADRVHMRFVVQLPPLVASNDETSEVDAASAQERRSKIDDLVKLLATVRDVAKGKPFVDWDALLDVHNPQASGAAVSQAAQRYPSIALTAVSTRITTAAHVAIVVHLEDPFKTKVRDEVLQHVLRGLTNVSATNAAAPSDMIVCADMMVELIRHELVLMRGAATTLDTLLRDGKTRRAAMTVIGRLAEVYSVSRQQEVLQLLEHARPSMQLAVGDAEYDYDVNSIFRHAGWRRSTTAPTSASGTSVSSSGATTPSAHPFASLVHCRTINTAHKQIVSTSYFSQRDEFVTGGLEKSIYMWGAPTYGETPSASFQAPHAAIPVSMDSSTRGNLLAVGCVVGSATATPATSSVALKSPKPASASANAAHSSVTSFIQAYVCSDAGAWTVGETIRRPEGHIITQVKCLPTKGSVLCAAETVSHNAADRQHQLVYFNASGTETRRFSKAHTDCITALTLSPDNENIMLTGSRDTTIRLWDCRNASSTSSTASASAAAVLEGHTDTITSMAAVRDVVLTASYDGTIRSWDLRRLKTSLSVKTFSAPVLKTLCLANAMGAASTLQGLYLLSLETLQVEDIVPNVCYTDLRTNHDGSVLLASQQHVDIYAVHVPKE